LLYLQAFGRSNQYHSTMVPSYIQQTGSRTLRSAAQRKATVLRSASS